MYRMRIFILVGRERENEREIEGGRDRWMDGQMEQREREARKRGGMDGKVNGWMDMEIDE